MIFGNGGYGTYDVQRLQRVATGLDNGFGAWRDVDPIIVGDIDGSGSITTLDTDWFSRKTETASGSAKLVTVRGRWSVCSPAVCMAGSAAIDDRVVAATICAGSAAEANRASPPRLNSAMMT